MTGLGDGKIVTSTKVQILTQQGFVTGPWDGKIVAQGCNPAFVPKFGPNFLFLYESIRAFIEP